MFIVYIESSFQHWVSFSFHPIPYICMCVYIYIYVCIHTHTHTQNTFCYSIIEPHHPLIFLSLILFFKLFFSLLSTKKQKQKPLLLPISPHLWLHFLQPFLFLCLFTSPTILYFTVTLPSLFFITWLFFFPFYLYKFNIISPIQSIFLPHKNYEYSLSLLMNFCSFL